MSSPQNMSGGEITTPAQTHSRDSSAAALFFAEGQHERDPSQKAAAVASLITLIRTLHAQLQTDDGTESDANAAAQDVDPATQWSNAAVEVCHTRMQRLLHALEPDSFEEPTGKDDEDRRQDDAGVYLARLETIQRNLHSFFQRTLDTDTDLSSLQFQPIATATAAAAQSTSASPDSTPVPSPSADPSSYSDSLLSFIELIIVFAIHSQRKEQVVHAIMSLPEHDQAQLMHSIRHCCSRFLPELKMLPPSDSTNSQSSFGGSLDGSASSALSSLTASWLAHSSSSPLSTPLSTPKLSTTPPHPFGPRLISPAQHHQFDKRSPHTMQSASTLSTSDAHVNGKPNNAGPGAGVVARSPFSSAVPSRATLDAQLTTAEARITSLEAENKHLTEKLRRMSEEEAALVQSHGDEVATLQEQLSNSISLKKHQELLRAESTRAAAQLFEVQDRMQQLERTLTNLEPQHAQTHLELQRMRRSNESMENEITTLHEQLEVAQAKAEELPALQTKNAKLLTRLESLANLKAEHSAMAQQHATLQGEVESLRAENQQYVTQIQPQVERYKTLVQQLESELRDAKCSLVAKDEALTELQTRIDDEHRVAMEREQRLREQIEQLQRTVASIDPTHPSLSPSRSPATFAGMASPRQSIASPRAHAENTDIDKLDDEDDDEEDTVEPLSSQLADHVPSDPTPASSTATNVDDHTSVTTLQQQLAHRTKEVEEAQSKVQEQSNRVAELENELTTLRTQLTAHADDAAQLSSLRSELDGALQRLSSSESALLAARSQDALTIASLHGKISGLAELYEEEVARLKEEVSALRTANQTLEAAAAFDSQSKNAQRSRSNSLKQASALVAEHAAKVEALETQLAQMSNEKATLRRSLDAALHEVESLRASHAADVHTLNAKIVALVHERDGRAAAAIDATDADDMGQNEEDEEDEMASSFNPSWSRAGDADGSAAPAADADVGTDDENKFHRLRTRMTSQRKEIRRLRLELTQSHEALLRVQTERAEADAKRDDDLAHALATLANNSNTNKHSPSGQSSAAPSSSIPLEQQLADSEQKIQLLLHHYKRLQVQYVNVAKKLTQMTHGPVAPPLSLTTINAREEMFERERIRVEEAELFDRERRLMSSAFYSIGMEWQNALLTGRVSSAAHQASATNPNPPLAAHETQP